MHRLWIEISNDIGVTRGRSPSHFWPQPPLDATTINRVLHKVTPDAQVLVDAFHAGRSDGDVVVFAANDRIIATCGSYDVPHPPASSSRPTPIEAEQGGGSNRIDGVASGVRIPAAIPSFTTTA
jgi:hypothetical protein